MQHAVYPEIMSGPPRPSKIMRPGQLALPEGTERYTVAGAGAVFISIEAGDTVSVRNVEGGQAAELIAADLSGKTDAGILGVAANSNAAGLKALLLEGDASLKVFRKGLERRGIDLGEAQAVRLFGAATPAGTEESFTIARDGMLIVAAPAAPMPVDGHETATPLVVTVRRAKLRPASKSAELPEPLADPVLDLRVKSSTAQSYFVKAGDFIQIIDVDGRQCTDFQCFSARKLDKGLDRPLDVTTTRTLMGSSYPMPGLHSKYYDQDMEPLVEVVQDTCGRHDAFALACAAKYYDDIGYPGHANCSTNFNFALADRGVTPRPGWMAVNFFFNTAIDAQGVVVSDEPWSRPGDYVLMRALTDLVCVSSACPDDTTPANGWSLTDIHVRTYSGAEKFSRATATRATPDAEPRMTRESGFHARFAEHTRNFVEYRGFWLPNGFRDGLLDEYWACRQKAVVMDLSALRKFEVTGPDAQALLQYVLTRDVKKLAVGQVVYTAMCYEHGGMIDDGTLMRLGNDNFRWIGGDDYSGEWLREQAAKLGLKVLVRSSTDQLHNIAVQGPESRDILKEIVWTSPLQASMAELEWFRFSVGRIGGGNGVPVVVSRTGYTGELGYEIFCHPRDAEKVFDAVWEAGKPRGLKPMGLAALDMVRIEAGLIFAGAEFSDQTDPFEAGIGFTVPLKSKTDDFIGRDALIRRKEHPAHKLVGLDIDANIDIGHGACVHIGRAQIGVVTSSTRSPLLGKTIALARLDIAHAEIGTEVEIGKLDGHAKRIPARVTAFPHYDPQKLKPRS